MQRSDTDAKVQKSKSRRRRRRRRRRLRLRQPTAAVLCSSAARQRARHAETPQRRACRTGATRVASRHRVITSRQLDHHLAFCIHPLCNIRFVSPRCSRLCSRCIAQHTGTDVDAGIRCVGMCGWVGRVWTAVEWTTVSVDDRRRPVAYKDVNSCGRQDRGCLCHQEGGKTRGEFFLTFLVEPDSVSTSGPEGCRASAAARAQQHRRCFIRKQ